MSASAAQAAGDTARVAAPAPIVTRSDGTLVGRFVLATAIIFPLDEAIRDLSAKSQLQSSTSLQSVANAFNHAALPGAYALSYALYGAGVVTANEKLAAAGWHSFASVVIAARVSNLLKAGFGRLRPSASTDAEVFHWGSTLSTAGSYAFPSGHATVAFAAAAATADELNHSAPRVARFVNPVLYGTAVTVGIARVYGQAHWASDVVVGAAIGTLTARVLVRGAYAHPGNIFDRVLVHGIIAADREGRAVIGWSATP